MSKRLLYAASLVGLVGGCHPGVSIAVTPDYPNTACMIPAVLASQHPPEAVLVPSEPPPPRDEPKMICPTAGTVPVPGRWHWHEPGRCKHVGGQCLRSGASPASLPPLPSGGIDRLRGNWYWAQAYCEPGQIEQEQIFLNYQPHGPQSKKLLTYQPPKWARGQYWEAYFSDGTRSAERENNNPFP